MVTIIFKFKFIGNNSPMTEWKKLTGLCKINLSQNIKVNFEF